MEKIWMNKQLNKRAGCLFIAFISLWLILDLYRTTAGVLQGDSGIYFTFCKNFFKIPFSYSDGQVSYGATSPLFCFFISILYWIFPTNWLFAMKLFSLTLLVLSAVISNRTVQGNVITYLGIVAGLYACRYYIFYSAGVFETGLVGFSVALLIYTLIKERFIVAIYISGILYLIRPELALVTCGVDLLILLLETNRKKNFLHMVLSALPVLTYTIYMTVMTGSILPSSISGRVIFANEFDYSIWEKWLQCFTYMRMEYDKNIKWIIFWGIIVLFSRAVLKWQKKYVYILLITALILLPHIVVPSVNHTVRYTIGIVPILFLVIGYSIKSVLNQKGVLQIAIVTAICLMALGLNLTDFKMYNTSVYSQDKFDILFGKDLKEKLEKIGVDGGTMLVYEIQHQYYLDNFRTISLDAIVGSEMLNYLGRKESLAEAIAREKIDYVVVHQSALTLPIFNNTEIQQLYRQGLEIAVGETVEIDGVIYKKILENDAVTKPYQLSNVPYIPKDELWVYGNGEPWENNMLFWQTVYEVMEQ